MQVNTTKKTDTSITFSVVASESELAHFKEHALKKLRSQVKISGFRENKAPLNLVEKHVDQNTLQTEFLDEAINHLYGSAIDQLKLRPVNRPQVAVKKFVPFSTAEFEIEVEVVGDITLGDYKKIKANKNPVSVTDKDVMEVIGQLRTRAAEKKEVVRAAKDGDEVTIDFKGVDDKGDAVNGAEGKGYPIVVGSNTFIPGFEPALIGMKPGEEKTFTVPFPKDYGVKALQGKKVTFTVTVHKVQELIEPKLDDTFATKVGPFKLLKELKEDVKKQITAEREQQANRDLENDIIKSLIAKSKVTVPSVLVEEQIEMLLRELRQNLSYRGLTYQEFLEREGKTEDEYRTEVLTSQAEERVKAGLLLSEVAEKEDIRVTPEELEVRMQLLKGQYQDPAMQAELSKPEARREIASRLLTEKTIAKLVEYSAK